MLVSLIPDDLLLSRKSTWAYFFRCARRAVFGSRPPPLPWLFGAGSEGSTGDMFLTWLVTGLGGVCAVLLLMMSLASLLFYAAEFAEEHMVLTGKLLRNAVVGVLGLHVVLLVDGVFPVWPVLIGIGCHLCYALLVGDFPRLDPASPAAVCAGIALIVDHFVWFSHLTTPNDLSMLNVVGFFLIFIWLVPVSCVLSFSVNELTLPTGRSSDARSVSLFKAAFAGVSEILRVRASALGDMTLNSPHQKGY